jgi:hypothetical protein
MKAVLLALLLVLLVHSSVITLSKPTLTLYSKPTLTLYSKPTVTLTPKPTVTPKATVAPKPTVTAATPIKWLPFASCTPQANKGYQFVTRVVPSLKYWNCATYSQKGTQPINYCYNFIKGGASQQSCANNYPTINSWSITLSNGTTITQDASGKITYQHTAKTTPTVPAVIVPAVPKTP